MLTRKTEIPLARMKQTTASGMRALAGKIDDELPGMAAPHHLRDAARALESGNHEGAKRHLQSAMHTMAPQSLTRHGVLDDDGHSKAKVNMDLINRHYLLVRDLEDGEAHNQALRATPATFTQPGKLPMGRSMDPTQLPGVAGNGPGISKTVRAAMVPAPAQNAGVDRAMAGGPKAPVRREVQLPGRPMTQAALSWAEVDRLIELSAQTPRLASTPAPYGKPDGPGLYGVKGNKHSDYFEQIVKALMEKRGMDKGRASAIAWGALRRWSSGRGHVHPEVRAAAGGALGEERVARARAHANEEAAWRALDMAIAAPDGGNAPSNSQSGGASVQPRVPAGSPQGGQFGSASGAKKGNGKTPKTSPASAQRKALMLKQAAQDRVKARALAAQLAALLASSKAATAKTAAATKAGATGKSASPTPTKTTVAAPSTARQSATTAPSATRKPTKKQLITTLRTQIAGLLSEADSLTAQAAKL